jgi:hypothetical protein
MRAAAKLDNSPALLALLARDASVAPHDENECEAGCEHAPLAVPQRALPHRKGITLLIERSGLGRRTALGCGLPSATLRRAGAPTLPGAPPIRSLLLAACLGFFAVILVTVRCHDCYTRWKLHRSLILLAARPFPGGAYMAGFPMCAARPFGPSYLFHRQNGSSPPYSK